MHIYRHNTGEMDDCQILKQRQFDSHLFIFSPVTTYAKKCKYVSSWHMEHITFI